MFIAYLTQVASDLDVIMATSTDEHRAQMAAVLKGLTGRVP